MTTLDRLQEEVERRYARLCLPAWPDPHPEASSPGEDEYSRVTDPGRYRIVHKRARVWVSVLQDALGVRTEVLPPIRSSGTGPVGFDRGVRLAPTRVVLPLVLLERDVPTKPGEPTLAGLDIAVARPEVVVNRVPACGCDACDDDSEELLGSVDEPIRHLVGGPFVVLRGRGWSAEWHPGGGEAGGGRVFEEVMEECRRLAAGEDVSLPMGTEAYVGHGWL